METFQIRNLSFSYPLRDKPALEDISLTVHSGEFIALCGPSGCGKTTLLRHLKPILSPHGQKTGNVLFQGAPLGQLEDKAQASKIGFVSQNPDNQIVTDKVWHELAFGLESLGMGTPTIRLRVAETACFFGMQTWFHKDVSELSGGQKQLLSLASVMAMQPEVLLLDEPTAQLDPIAAREFIGMLTKINRELGTTVLISEHRLEEVFPVSDRAVVLDAGKLIAAGTPRQVGEVLKEKGHGMFLSMPSPMRIYAAVPSSLPCPVTIRDGRRWLDELAGGTAKTEAPPAKTTGKTAKSAETGKHLAALVLKDVWFRYGKSLPDVIRGLSLSVAPGEICAIVGGNGSGKTTALSILGGLQKPYRGRVLLDGQELFRPRDKAAARTEIGILPQNPQALFVGKTVFLDLLEMLDGASLDAAQKNKAVEEIAKRTGLTALLSMHPYDLSGGEQQRAALAKVLLRNPRILLLDEPTKGMDGQFKQTLGAILQKLSAGGVTILMVSHDIEFCALFADRCALLFDGGIITENAPKAFFSGNSYYTTAANRMARHLFPHAVTPEDVIEQCEALQTAHKN